MVPRLLRGILPSVDRGKRPKATPVGDDFSEWMKATSAPRASRASWANIPDEAAEELRQIIDHNDNNPNARIPAETALKRMRDRWGWKSTHSTLLRYCRRVLGRESWTSK